MIVHVLIAAVALSTGQTPNASTARGTPVTVLPFPTGEVRTLNLIEWNSNQLPPIYERSDQLPLTDEEVAKLSKAGFTAPQLVKMIQERRCACDASADGLIRLKQAGVDPEVLSALSLHSLPPNRTLNLLVTLDFTGASREARDAFLYFFVEDGELTRVLSLNIPDLLRNQNAHDTTVDRSDILRARLVRRIQLPGAVPLKAYGTHRLMVVSSAKPTLTHPSQLTEQERSKAQVYTFEYPRSSLQSLCRLTAGYRQDAVLAYKWRFEGSRFECEWN